MFTGLIQKTAQLLDKKVLSDEGVRFFMRADWDDLTLGESIAVEGVCLTLISTEKEGLGFDIGPETLRCTTLGTLDVGAKLNLERALRLDNRLGGHWVTGHVDGVATCVSKIDRDDFHLLTFQMKTPPPKGYWVRKGSVTLNGVSLTLSEVTEDSFSVMLIPETLRHTNLSELSPGALVNIEHDYLAKITVAHLKGKIA